MNQLLNEIIELAKEAGNAILTFYKKKLEIQVKSDNTPVTVADLKAHTVIVEKLQTLTPNIPILSEEDADIDYEVRRGWHRYWLIDPLDGTKEFIHETDEFTVNIALIDNGKAVLGVIYAPVLQSLYFASKGFGAYKLTKEQAFMPIKTQKIKDTPIKVAISRRHVTKSARAFLNQIPDIVKMPKGSSLKTCLVAEGLADVYPCLGKTSEWDMGAAQCIIEEAGGMMVDLNFHPIRFNQKASLLNPPLLVAGDKDYNWKQFINH